MGIARQWLTAAALLVGSSGVLAAPAAALDHILEVKQDVVQAAQGLGSPVRLATPLPGGALGGFDTHSNQQATQERLLGELAAGLSVAVGMALRRSWIDSMPRAIRASRSTSGACMPLRWSAGGGSRVRRS